MNCETPHPTCTFYYAPPLFFTSPLSLLPPFSTLPIIINPPSLLSPLYSSIFPFLPPHSPILSSQSSSITLSETLPQFTQLTINKPNTKYPLPNTKSKSHKRPLTKNTPFLPAVYSPSFIDYPSDSFLLFTSFVPHSASALFPPSLNLLSAPLPSPPSLLSPFPSFLLLKFPHTTQPHPIISFRRFHPIPTPLNIFGYILRSPTPSATRGHQEAPQESHSIHTQGTPFPSLLCS